MSNGEPIMARVAMKPLATLNRPVLKTVDVVTKEETVSFKERTDVTAVPAMGVVAETMMALVLASEALRKFGGDSIERGPAQPRGRTSRASGRRERDSAGPAHRHDGRRQVDDRAAAGPATGLAVPRQRRRDRTPDRPDRPRDLEGPGRSRLPRRGIAGPGPGDHGRTARRSSPSPAGRSWTRTTGPAFAAPGWWCGCGRRWPCWPSGSARGRVAPCLDGGPAAALARLYEQRAPIYEELADVTFDVDRLAPRDVVAEIVEALHERSGADA